MKLTGNFMLFGFVNTMSEALTLSDKNGIPRDDILAFVEAFFPAPPIQVRLRLVGLRSIYWQILVLVHHDMTWCTTHTSNVRTSESGPALRLHALFVASLTRLLTKHHGVEVCINTSWQNE